jgi:hypothetical protein
VPKKANTPDPPRRVQAPKQRLSGSHSGGRNPWLLPGIGAAIGLVAIAAVVGFLLLRGDGAAAALADAGCTLETYPSQGREHIEEPQEDFEYNSFPPTTGPHHPVPSPWDVFDEPVDQLRLIHNLEHGGLVIQYGEDVPQAEVEAIVAWYRKDPNGKIIAPLPDLGDEIALAAWAAPETPGTTDDSGEGVVAKCPTFDAKAFDEFKSSYGFRGPERFPREFMTPGS